MPDLFLVPPLSWPAVAVACCSEDVDISILTAFMDIRNHESAYMSRKLPNKGVFSVIISVDT
jgi:hypothetical protein